VEAAPEDTLTLDAVRAVASAQGDRQGELEALRRLEQAIGTTSGGALDSTLVERRAELELELGEAGVAVDLYTELVRRHPEDPRLRDGLAAAQFRFRVALLPDEVKRLTTAQELTRGDFATLLYWLVPGARGGRSEAATIVSDVPEEHPQRVAILRIVNLGLLPLEDAALRRFAPDAPMLRGRALRSLLQLATSGQPAAACLEPLTRSPRPSIDLVCGVAAGCGWLDDPGVCLPSVPIDGPTAERFLRRALGLVGG
jgi:hypothetical protein